MAGKNVSKMTYFVSRETQPYSITQVCPRLYSVVLYFNSCEVGHMEITCLSCCHSSMLSERLVFFRTETLSVMHLKVCEWEMLHISGSLFVISLAERSKSNMRLWLAVPLAACVKQNPCTSYHMLTPSTECHQKSVQWIRPTTVDCSGSVA